MLYYWRISGGFVATYTQLEFHAGGNPEMDWHFVQGGSGNTPIRFMCATETGITSRMMGHLARMKTFY